jgi:hypothetical protein
MAIAPRPRKVRTIPVAPLAQNAPQLQFALSGVVRALLTRTLSALRNSKVRPVGKVLDAVLANDLEPKLRAALLSPDSDARARRAVLMALCSAADLEQSSLTLHTLPPQLSPRNAQLLTSTQAAVLLQFSVTHVKKLMDTGHLGEIIKSPGGHRRIWRTAIAAYTTGATVLPAAQICPICRTDCDLHGQRMPAPLGARPRPRARTLSRARR